MAPLKSGDMPRTLICCALPLPLLRCAATPGRREMESAIDGSGSLPRSSEVMASTMELASFLMAMADSMARRIPVMVTTSGAAAPVCWA